VVIFFLKWIDIYTACKFDHFIVRPQSWYGRLCHTKIFRNSKHSIRIIQAQYILIVLKIRNITEAHIYLKVEFYSCQSNFKKITLEVSQMLDELLSWVKAANAQLFSKLISGTDLLLDAQLSASSSTSKDDLLDRLYSISKFNILCWQAWCRTVVVGRNLSGAIFAGAKSE